MPLHDPSRVPTLLALVAPAGASARKLKPIAKALVAGASVAIAVAIPLVSGGLSAGEALTIAGAFLAGAFPTWAVPNRKPE